MLLSILIGGKNDNYAADSTGKGGVCKRLQLTLNKTLDNIKRLGVDDVEVVVCDWGSNNKISEELVSERHPLMKFVYVSPDITKKYNNGSGYSIVHPYNVSFRHSTGKYVVFWDSDCFMPFEHFKSVYEFAKKLDAANDKKFYWGSRFHIPRSAYVDADTFSDVDAFLADCVIDTSQSNRTPSDKILRHDKINLQNFGGCAMALLMHRDLGEDSTCWWEELQFWGWQDIELHHRLNRKYIFGGDMEEMGMLFFHLDHHEAPPHPFMNQHKVSTRFRANGENWGLANEKLEVIV